MIAVILVANKWNYIASRLTVNRDDDFDDNVSGNRELEQSLYVLVLSSHLLTNDIINSTDNT
jgi:hypothetical protein